MAAQKFEHPNQVLSRLHDFAEQLEQMRSCSWLSIAGAKGALAENGNDAARARLSLAGIVGQRAPHERGLASDVHITGHVGCRVPVRRHRANSSATDASEAKSVEAQPFAPMTRPLRVANAKGETSFYLGFERITKADTLPRRTAAAAGSARSAEQRRPASAEKHVWYIEREEARPGSRSGDVAGRDDDADLGPDEGSSAPRSVSGEEYREYQNRGGAVAHDSAGEALVLTNILGTTKYRANLWRAIQWSEPEGNESQLAINPLLPIGNRFCAAAKADLELAAIADARDDDGNLSIPLHHIPSALKILKALGWSPKKPCGKVSKKGKPKAEGSWLKEQAKRTGVYYVHKRSGCVQMRIVGELPHEVDFEGHRRILQGMVRPFEERGIPYEAVIHAPTNENNERNWHFHIIYYERPVKVFTGKADDHLPGLPEAKRKAAAEALEDPSVQAQIGKWDFEVVRVQRTPCRHLRKSRPFQQNKDRWFDRLEFIPEMRRRLAELTNQELERGGYSRRVFAGKMKDNGIHKETGEKLSDWNNQLEFEGIPTRIGTTNERKQWKYVEAQIERQYQDDLRSIEAERSRFVANDDGSHRQLTIDQWKALGYWKTKREQEALARRAYRWGEQIAERLYSRPAAMFDNHINHLNAAYQPGAKASLKRERAWRERMVVKIHEHLEATRILFAEELQLAVHARELVRERADEAQDILKAAGLVSDPVFEIDRAIGGELSANTETVEPAKAPQSDADTGFADQVFSTSANEAPPPPQPLAATPTPTAVPAHTPPAQPMQPPPRKLPDDNKAERRAAEPPSAASKPATRIKQEPASRPRPIPQAPGSAVDTGAAHRLVSDLKRGRRLLVRRDRSIVPLEMTAAETTLVAASEYRQLSTGLERTLAQQDSAMTKEIVDYIAFYGTSAFWEIRQADGSLKLELRCNHPKIVQAFPLYSSVPEVQAAIQDAKQSAAEEVERARRKNADVDRQSVTSPETRRQRRDYDAKKNGQLLDRIAKERIPFMLTEQAGGLMVAFSAEARSKFTVPASVTLKGDHHIARIRGLHRAQRPRAEEHEGARQTVSAAPASSPALHEHPKSPATLQQPGKPLEEAGAVAGLPGTEPKAAVTNESSGTEAGQVTGQQAATSAESPIVGPARTGYAEKDEADHLADENTKRPEPGNEAQEVAAARAFVDRVRNMVVRVGTTEAGLVVPHPSYWAKNGLTERGLRDAAVQKVLAGIRQRQIDYMNRLTPILQAHVDARILEQGPAAMVQALPEGERAEARQYSKTVMWKTAMEWLVEDGRRLSRIGLKRWKKACEKESVSRFAEAANALRQHQRWPLDLEPRTLAELKNDAVHHVRMIGAQQAAARDQGLG